MSNTPTPLSREELKNTVLHEMAHLIAEYAQLTADDIMVLVDSFIKAFADEVRDEVIGANDTYQKASTEDLVNPFHLYQGKNKLRREQRSALKDLLEKWGME